MKKSVLFLFLCVYIRLGAQVEIFSSVIAHSPKMTQQYIGTPSILSLGNEKLLASHDYFGSGCMEDTTFVYSSEDNGLSWQRVATIPNCFWAGLFFVKQDVYLLGVNGHKRQLSIWVSKDQGHTWSHPFVLREGSFHGSSTPVVMKNGRIYKGYDHHGGEDRPWMSKNASFIMSASIHSDLTSPDSWTYSDELCKPDSLDGSGWLETNVVQRKDGGLCAVTRLQTAHGATVGYYDMENDSTIDMSSVCSLPFIGGATKFNIKWDKRTKEYWSLVNYPPAHLLATERAGGVRCVVALIHSKDLHHWDIKAILFGTEEIKQHGFQYMDWYFDKKDIVFVSRTAYDDEWGGANRAHDANYLTFHRICDYENAVTPQQYQYLLPSEQEKLLAQEQAAMDLVKRVLPDHYKSFVVQISAKDTLAKDWFEIEQFRNKIILRGTNGVSIASALNHYLVNYTNSRISWSSIDLHIPNPMPIVPHKVRRETQYRYRYYFNYCTFNYSMSWWNWERWQREIDFMAMHGINLPLALTGQNSIWQRVYHDMGFSNQDLASFFPGPAYFNWFWMGNLDGWGGPLPQSFIDGHEKLQKQILERERSLGMTPILPAFTGHVPPAFVEKFPQAKVKVTHWVDFPAVYVLDPEDPMFEQIGTAFLRESIRTYGTDHFYSSDTFNENKPPLSDSIYLDGISRKIYGAMQKADPKAVWVMQGWIFVYSGRDFWGETQTKALLNAVPNDRMIVLDLWAECRPAWHKKNAFYGKQWLWCMLNNFGGNNLMYGRMDEVASAPYEAFRDSLSGNMQGIGITPEAIEQNPVIYEMMLDHIWRDEPIIVTPWLRQYAKSRYGVTNDTIDMAWDILYRTVYSGGKEHGGPTATIIAGRPTLNKDSHWTETDKLYQAKDLLPAWSYLISQSAALESSDGFRYDLVDVTRQILANYADSVQRKLSYAYQHNDLDTYRVCADKFLQIILDMDTLVNTRKEWRLGTWVESAKSWGSTSEEKALYECNAKNLIATWGPRDSEIYDYSWRLWSDMLQSYYYVRWKMFFDYMEQCIATHSPFNQGEFDEQVKDWEWSWVNTLSSYQSTSPYSEIDICNKLYSKYSAEIFRWYN